MLPELFAWNVLHVFLRLNNFATHLEFVHHESNNKWKVELIFQWHFRARIIYASFRLYFCLHVPNVPGKSSFAALLGNRSKIAEIFPRFLHLQARTKTKLVNLNTVYFLSFQINFPSWNPPNKIQHLYKIDETKFLLTLRATSFSHSDECLFATH